MASAVRRSSSWAVKSTTMKDDTNASSARMSAPAMSLSRVFRARRTANQRSRRGTALQLVHIAEIRHVHFLHAFLAQDVGHRLEARGLAVHHEGAADGAAQLPHPGAQLR